MEHSLPQRALAETLGLPGLVGSGLAAVTYDHLATPRRRERPIAAAVTHPDPADLAAAK